MRLIYTPDSRPMRIAVGVSSSGTNFREIHKADPGKSYVVFSDRECPGLGIVDGVPKVKLDAKAFFNNHGANLKDLPLNDPLRSSYDRDMFCDVEEQAGGRPDLICLAGYGLWLSDVIVNRYFPCILNVHPGDTTKGYAGYGWVPSAQAILAGDTLVKSTVFLVDKTKDKGPILIQSESLPLKTWKEELDEVLYFARRYGAGNLDDFTKAAQAGNRNDLRDKLKSTCSKIQEMLKVEGDWRIYPFAVHELIAKGRVAIDNGCVYVDDIPMPKEGYQADIYGFSERITR